MRLNRVVSSSNGVVQASCGVATDMRNELFALRLAAFSVGPLFNQE